MIRPIAIRSLALLLACCALGCATSDPVPTTHRDDIGADDEGDDDWEDWDAGAPESDADEDDAWDDDAGEDDAWDEDAGADDTWDEDAGDEDPFIDEPEPICPELLEPVGLTTLDLGSPAAHCYTRDGSCDFDCTNATRTFEGAFSVNDDASLDGTVPLHLCRRSPAGRTCDRFSLSLDPTCGGGVRVETLGYVLPPGAPPDDCGSAPLAELYNATIDDHIYTHDPAYRPAGYVHTRDVATVWVE